MKPGIRTLVVSSSFDARFILTLDDPVILMILFRMMWDKTLQPC